MSDNSDINFHSGDIKKKDLDFNVEEKKTKKFSTSIKKIKDEILASPPIKGKNKFITLGVVVVVLAAAITLPIVLPSVLSSDPSPEPTPEEQDESQEIREGVADIINNIDPDASLDTQEVILADLDAKIASAVTEEDIYFYTPAKANALVNFKRYDEAIATLEPLIDQYRAEKQWTPLANVYSFISYIYQITGDNAAAVEWIRGALAVVDEAASDPDKPENISGRDYYQSVIDQLEGR